MSERVGVVWDDRLAEYDFGPGHPLAPIRVQLAMRLAAEFGLFAPAHVSILTPVEPVDDDAILRVHERRVRARPCRRPRPTRTSTTPPAASAPTTTRCSPACTRPPAGSRGRA